MRFESTAAIPGRIRERSERSDRRRACAADVIPRRNSRAPAEIPRASETVPQRPCKMRRIRRGRYEPRRVRSTETAHLAVGGKVARHNPPSGRESLGQGEPERLVLRHAHDGLRPGQPTKHIGAWHLLHEYDAVCQPTLRHQVDEPGQGGPRAQHHESCRLGNECHRVDHPVHPLVPLETAQGEEVREGCSDRRGLSHLTDLDAVGNHLNLVGDLRREISLDDTGFGRRYADDGPSPGEHPPPDRPIEAMGCGTGRRVPRSVVMRSEHDRRRRNQRGRGHQRVVAVEVHQVMIGPAPADPCPERRRLRIALAGPERGESSHDDRVALLDGGQAAIGLLRQHLDADAQTRQRIDEMADVGLDAADVWPVTVADHGDAERSRPGIDRVRRFALTLHRAHSAPRRGRRKRPRSRTARAPAAARKYAPNANSDRGRPATTMNSGWVETDSLHRILATSMPTERSA